ncbi:CinA family nicotinamide mononucleotide deamidase-related protein [Gilliamella apicola]|uniref:CinA family nicotinamide mononucleotide deamidase-related protein n=1 Tax=Gilliamella apicola TaxID=1196095 RepID=UPI002FEE2CC6
MNKKMIKIEMLSTGDEVLYGQIIDTNAAWLSQLLFQEGILITSRHTVGDDLTQLICTLKLHSLDNDIIIVNGGLGPTSDDLSAQAAALANNESLILHQEWVHKIKQYFSNRGKTMPPSNIKQAMLPQSATLIDNPIGTACGFKMQINQCLLYFTPGVPSEFKEMVKTSILPEIKLSFPTLEKKLCYRLMTMGQTESDLATQIDSKLNIPTDIVVGYRAAMPMIELKLTGPELQKNKMDELWQQIKSIVANNLLYEGVLTQHGDLGLAMLVSRILLEKDQTIAVIEQQSAGVIAHQLFECEAPLVKSEIVPLFPEDPKAYFLDILTKYRADIVLGLVNFRERNTEFTLIIATSQQFLKFNLKYTGRQQNRHITQKILCAIALDALRRYLENMPIIGTNVWLDLIE